MNYVRTAALLTAFAATATSTEAQYLNPDLGIVNDGFMIELRAHKAGAAPDKSGHFTLSATNDEGDQFTAKFADNGDDRFGPKDSLVYLRVDAGEPDSAGTLRSYVATRNIRNGFDITQSKLAIGKQHRDDTNTRTIVPGSTSDMGNAQDITTMTGMIVALSTGKKPPFKPE